MNWQMRLDLRPRQPYYFLLRSCSSVDDHESGVLHVALASRALPIALPTLNIEWIGEHEIELVRRKRVVGEVRMLGSTDDVVLRVAFPIEQ